MAIPRRRGLAAVVLVTSLALTSCSGQADNASEKNKDSKGSDKVVLASAMLPESLNPLSGYGGGGISKINQGLYTIETVKEGTGSSKGADRSGAPKAMPKLVPLLAEGEPETKDKGKSYTVTLKDGVKFTDGTDLDASDIVATYEAILDPKVGSPLISDMGEIEKVEADGDNKVVFTFKTAMADVKPLLMVGIAPSEHIKKGETITESEMNRKPIGTGPYKVEEFKPGRFVLVSNPDYFMGEPALKRIESIEVKDDAARAQRMTSGEFNGTILPPRAVSAFEDNPDFSVYQASSADWRGISLPKDNPLTNTREGRLALNKGIDREAIVRGVLADRGRASASMIPDVYGDLYTEKGEIAEDRDEALKLFEKAGWKLGGDKLMKDGKQAELNIMYPSEDTLRRDIAVALGDQFKKLGINSKVEGVDWSVAEERLDKDAMMFGGGMYPYNADAQVYRALHTPDDQEDAWLYNPSGYSNKDMDKALDKARSTLDAKERVENYHKIQELYAEDPAMLVVGFIDHNYVQAKNVEDQFNRTGLLVEPHEHGTDWGPWAQVQEWKKK